MKTLVLMRHAKAEPHSELGDKMRPLAQRGRNQSRSFGQQLVQEAGPFDVALVSSALRTTETYKLLAGEVEGYPSPRLEDELYEASPRALLTKLQGLPSSVERVIVVGHEPVMSSLAHMLDDQRGPGSDNLSLGIPTATAVVLDAPVEWSELERQSANVRAVLRPSED